MLGLRRMSVACLSSPEKIDPFPAKRFRISSSTVQATTSDHRPVVLVAFKARNASVMEPGFMVGNTAYVNRALISTSSRRARQIGMAALRPLRPQLRQARLARRPCAGHDGGDDQAQAQARRGEGVGVQSGEISHASPYWMMWLLSCFVRIIAVQ